MTDLYPILEPYLVQIQLILVMFAMGAEHLPSEFRDVVRRPGSLILGLGMMYLVTPLLALVIVKGFQLPPDVAFGLLLVASMPGGSLSNIFTYLGKGNVPLSIAMTTFATIGSIVTVPTLLDLLASSSHAVRLEMPIAWILRDIGLYLLLPLAGGMLARQVLPEATRVLTPWCLRGGLLALLCVVIGSLTGGRIDPGSQGWKTPIAIILFCVASQQLTMAPFRVLGWPTPDRFAAGVEVTVRNVNLALLLTVLPGPSGQSTLEGLGPGVLFVVLYYGAVSIVTCIPAIGIHRRIVKKHRARRGLEEDSVDAL